MVSLRLSHHSFRGAFGGSAKILGTRAPLSSRYRKSIPTTTETLDECTRFPIHTCRQHSASNRSVFLDATSVIPPPRRAKETSKAARDRPFESLATDRICYWSLLTCGFSLKGPRRHRGIAQGATQQVRIFKFAIPNTFTLSSLKVR